LCPRDAATLGEALAPTVEQAIKSTGLTCVSSSRRGASPCTVSSARPGRRAPSQAGGAPQRRGPCWRTGRRELRCQVGVGTFTDPVPQETLLNEAPQRPRDAEHLQQPRDVVGESGVLQVEAPLAADPDGAGDHGPVSRADNPRSPLASALLGGLQREREQVAVAAEACAEKLADAREDAPVPEQQIGGADCAGREDQAVRRDGARGRARPSGSSESWCSR
jgi:hypothetical protein